ncbi:hypothetical protein NC651_003585 [Populus alba x Populus x berolinensis]|nr:hypothetical protein NC651_003585 [Populus alba x Populus x berolinensis]
MMLSWSNSELLGKLLPLESTSGFSQMLCTIAVISVESQELVQFGSTQKVSTLKANRILESEEFLGQTKQLFGKMENINGLTSNSDSPSSLNCESYERRLTTSYSLL